MSFTRISGASGGGGWVGGIKPKRKGNCNQPNNSDMKLFESAVHNFLFFWSLFPLHAATEMPGYIQEPLI